MESADINALFAPEFVNLVTVVVARVEVPVTLKVFDKVVAPVTESVLLIVVVAREEVAATVKVVAPESWERTELPNVETFVHKGMSY